MEPQSGAGAPQAQVPLASATDEEIVTRIRSGDTAGFETLMRRHNQRLYRTVRAILGGDADAEDAMQDAYIQAFRHLDDFEGRARFATWLTRIAVREALGRRRRLAAHETFAMDEDDAYGDTAMELSHNAGPSPEDLASGVEIRTMLEDAIDSLPEHFRTVFMLRSVQELSVAETAACLDLQEETVKTRLHRARALLQESLLARSDRVVVAAYAFHAPRCNRVVANVLRMLGVGEVSK